ncbi:hypothetical protein V8E54_004983, partial [Elaphomyces granulatus]
LGVDGRTLDPVCYDPDRVSDDLLRWHFRQSIVILANRAVGLRGGFPDMMAALRAEPYGKE